MKSASASHEEVRRIGRRVSARVAHPAIHAIRIRPVRLHGHEIESLVDDQRLGQLGAGLVELVRAVRGFADQHEARVADGVEHRTESVRRRFEPPRGVAKNLDGHGGGHGSRVPV